MSSKASVQLKQKIENLRLKLKEKEQLFIKKNRAQMAALNKKTKRERNAQIFILGRSLMDDLNQDELIALVEMHVKDPKEKALFRTDLEPSEKIGVPLDL